MVDHLYQSIKLDWCEIGCLAGQLISDILDRPMRCNGNPDDYDFWTVVAVEERFSLEDLQKLLDYVDANDEMRRVTIPEDSDSTYSLDMELSAALLRKCLNTDWREEHISKDGLWLMGVNVADKNLHQCANICIVDSMAIDLRTLWPKDELLQRLFESGGAVGDLSDLCDRYVKQYGNELYWAYPISNGMYNGVYFIMVQEGILCLPYYVIDKECYEVFEEDGVCLATAEEMSCYLTDWEQASANLKAAMESFHKFLKVRERNNEREA